MGYHPAVLFGGEDILINNIAWVLRHLPIFGVFGAGQYRLQPIHVHDYANLAVAQGVEREDRIIDAIGPETYRYRKLVGELARILGVRRPRCLFRRGLAMPPVAFSASSSGTFSSRAMKSRASCKTSLQPNPSQRAERSYPRGHASTPLRWAGVTRRSWAGGGIAASRMSMRSSVPLVIAVVDGQRYLVSGARPHVPVKKDAALAEFQEVAAACPVFRLASDKPVPRR
jgi:hypothetical protein